MNIIIHINFSKIALLIFSVVLINVCYGQDGYLNLKGKVKKSNGTLSEVSINLYEKNELIKSVSSTHDGTFEVDFRFDKQYIIHFVKEGYVTKKIAFSSKLPEYVNRYNIITYRFSVWMFEMYPGLDISVMDEPVSRIEFNKVIENFDYDHEFAEKRKKDIEQLLRDLEELKRKAYKITLQTADDHFNDQEYEEAIVYYNKAIEQRVEQVDLYAEDRIYECEVKIEEKNKKLAENEVGEVLTDPDELINMNFSSENERIKYLEGLSDRFPEGITMKKFKQQGKDITQYIVRKGDIVNDLRKVKYSWGGEFFFKNGQGISKTIFDVETKATDIKY